MTDRLTSKFKGFFKGDAKSDQKVPAQLKRGVPANVDELRKWYAASSFGNLEKRGQEAFFKFLRGDVYTEDMDIIFVPLTNDEVDAKRYQFWLKCENIDLKDLFDFYIMDDETKLKDVRDSYPDREKLKEKAVDVDSYVSNIKDKMKPDLDGQFSKFKTSLKDYEKTFDS